VRLKLLVIGTIISLYVNAQTPIGAWESISVSDNGDKLRSIMIFAEGYQVLTIYNAASGKFIHTNGGTWNLNGETMTERIEFHTDKPSLVGTESSFKVAVSNDSLKLIGSNRFFKRIDDATTGTLQGAWLMSGRVKDGITQMRDTSTPRKTMKILSGTRFQWIAYNTATKEFLGTGGGTYTAKNDGYMELIEFFSRDDTKAGQALKFQYKLIDGNWHHSGLSSKGDAIHEIWSIRK